MTLKHFLDDFYAPLRAISPRTKTLYSYTIAAFGEFLGRPAALADLQELAVARFLARRVEEKAPATAAKDRAQLRALWEFAARRRMVENWPTIPLVRVPLRVPECWLTEEFQRLLNAAGGETTTISGIRGCDFWRALLLLAYDTGERATALICLKWRCFKGDAVLFVAEDRKGRRADIFREISQTTVAAVEILRGSRKPDDLVFPWDKSQTYLWRRLGVILERAGLPAGRRDKFHKIRKTTASYYEAAGGSAQELLDHASPQTTRAYLDPRVVRGKPAPDILPKVS